MGRPTRYKAEFAEQAYKLCLLGLTDAEMAQFFGIQESTLNNWKKRHKPFMQSIEQGRIPADMEVAVKLRERAMGYTHPEEKIFIHEGKVIRVQTQKHYPPDERALRLWLMNRQPGKWRDRVQHEHGGIEDGDPIVVEVVKFGAQDQNSG